jgi:hypothetical protein
MTKPTVLVCAMAVSMAVVAGGAAPEPRITLKNARGGPAAIAARLAADGWKEVKPGVFEKRDGAHFWSAAVGASAKAHARVQLKKRYEVLLRSGKSASPEVSRALAGIRQTLAAIDRHEPRLEADCNLDMDVLARIYSDDGSVTAYGRAHHFNSCGPGAVGVFLHAAAGGGSESRSCYDYGWHFKVCEYAVTVSGPPPCYAEAYAYAYDEYFGYFIEDYVIGDCSESEAD